MFKESITPEEISKFETVGFGGRISVITQEGPAFESAIRYLRRQKVIGFDTETRPCFVAHQHQNNVALLQLSGADRAFLFRLNQMGLPKRICSILASPKIIKVGAAVHDDIRGLKKHRDFNQDGFVDLQKIGSEWGIQDKSVKKMAGIILGIRISKTQQLSNWEAENLTEAQAVYAATDAWVCREMYLRLMDTPKPEVIQSQTENK